MKEKIRIENPSQTAELLKAYCNKKQEHFGIICVDGGLNVISRKALFKGGVDKTSVYLNKLFWEMCRKNSCGVILFHNHPSGNVLPSEDDIITTQKIEEGCALLGIQLLDHVIVSRDKYYSFKEHSLIGNSEESEEKIAEKE